MKLRVAPDLALPVEAVSDVIAILGRRGRGKTTTATVIVEELHATGARFCVCDPTDAWWGLKSSRDGKSPGIPCVVMGGEHGDVPLASESGEIIADFVADPASPSCVLELKQFTQGEMVRFMTAFLARLYHRNAHPLHLVLDEADQFAPQRPMPGEMAMLGAAQRVTKMGRNKGLHPMLITQRPATLSKNVLTQAGMLISHAITGPQDRKAVDEWIKANAEEGEREKFLNELAGLPRGTAYFWSPDIPIFRQVAVRDRKTFDSSATPGQTKRVEPKALADVDLDALKLRIAATIEKAKADDPRELRKTIERLGRQLKEEQTKIGMLVAQIERGKVERVEVPVFTKDDAGEFHKSSRGMVDHLRMMLDKIERFQVALLAARQDAPPQKATRRDGPGSAAQHVSPERGAVATTAAAWSRSASRSGSNGDVGSGGLRRILIALAQRQNGLTVQQIGLRAGLSSRSGTFSTYMSRARSHGWIEVGHRGPARITKDGIAALGDYEPLPTGADLLNYWIGQLGSSGASRMLQALADVYPKGLSNDDLGEAAGISSRSGTFSTYLSRLRGLELVEGRGELRASEELFS